MLQSSPPITSTSAQGAAAPALSRHAGIHVLRVAGDDYEMGHQHGVALRDAIGRGPLPYFERYVEKLLAGGAGPTAGRALARALSATVGRRIARGFPEHTRRALDGLADGAGLDKKQLLGAVTMPESYLYVLGQLLKVKRPRLAPRHGVPMMGCTSAIAWGGATKTGALLHGRNFDYQGVGAWDREQAVVFHRPKDGQPYVAVSAAGILFGGITAMNAAGLSLVVHQHMGSDALQLGGTPIGVTGDLIMRHARSLDDAQRILDDDRPSGCWTYNIASAREGAVLCYETTPRRHAAHRFTNELFAYSNFFLDRDLAGTEHELYPAQWRNNLARFQRASALLEAERGRIDANTIARILGDAGDGCGVENAIRMIMTVASVVFEPGAGIVYVATGRAPVSKRDYVAFDLATQSVAERPPLTGGHARDEAAAAAFDAYRAAYEAHHDDDLVTARRELERARRLAPREAVFHYVAGLLALQDGDSGSALEAFDRALDLGHPAAERVAAFHLWRARARDLLGRRNDALSDYRDARRGNDGVRRAAERGLGRRWRPRRFGLEMVLGDVPMP